MDNRRLASTRRRFAAGTAGAVAALAYGIHGRALAQEATPGASPVATPTPVEPPGMTGAIYEFQIGSFQCLSVSDGASAGPFVEAVVVGGMPEEEAQAIIEQEGVDPSQLISQHTSSVIDTGSELVLVDTGAGTPGLPTSGILIDNLRRAGIQPPDVDVVVLTHAHPDHIGGAVTANGNPLYPNARYLMAQEEWDFWTDTAQVEETFESEDLIRNFLSAVENSLLPLEDTIELIGFDEEIVPGVTSVDSRGHTPGHMSLRVESDGEQLWVMGDSAINPLNLEYPEMIGLADTYPEQTIETRQRLFAEIADANGLATFNHFHPFPSTGDVVSEGDTWRWEPVEDAAGEEES